MEPKVDNDDERERIPLGDLGTILIAAVFLIGFLWLMFGPSPFAPLIEQAKEVRAHQTGEVTVTMPPPPQKKN